jgi:hypothetical protein
MLGRAPGSGPMMHEGPLLEAQGGPAALWCELTTVAAALGAAIDAHDVVLTRALVGKLGTLLGDRD